ncbi:pilus assembly protein TadG-related protein [Nocardioides sp. J54]|uniref:pilus assembly protein TadG-related protein n=1 Tax=Nocardioides sp. J54 TaxID=935866 RepID=UPI00048FED20|nr:hypothetical protein [Nocardioides sp. J54]
MWHRRGCARDDQRGAVTLVMVVVTAVLMVGSAFVVDIGLQRVARADMQAVADLVALDLARELDGRTVAELTPVLDEVLAESAARNADIVGEGADLDYEVGHMDTSGFQQMSSGVPSAVRVVAHTEVAFAFASITGDESGEATRTAAAESSSTACFRLGSFVAAIRSGDSTVLAPLNDLLGVNLDLVGYRGLALADVRLLDLAATTVIGSPERLLGGTITYAELVLATIEALSNEPEDNAVAITALHRIASSAVTASVGTISLGDVLNVAPTDRAALGIDLDVLDLVASARLSDGEHFIGVPNIQGGVPGVGFQFTGGITLVAAAELACGVPNSAQAVADTAQLDGTLGIKFTNMPSLNIPGLGTLQTPKGSGSLEVVAGSGTGRLVSPPQVHCGDGSAVDPATFSVQVASGLASYQLHADVSVAADVKLSNLLGLGLTSVLTNLLGNILDLGSKISLEVEVRLTIGTSSSGGGGRADLRLPPNDETPVSVGSAMTLDVASIVPTVTSVKFNGQVAQLPAVTAITGPILEVLTTSGKGFVEKTLTPLVENINQQFIGPVARMVGLRLAGADVYAVGVTCATPRLVG